ncbi:lipopolysaccharide biosynthesis protein [Hyphococcus flavus]|uniref:Lipopolysaccharide biosynthesis protein n=1 Tax=Hyphococcus flavus TaxID=1866326 RepID=A0AAE9ZJM6_9PROT|nr:lipopolysaccharide biosynthesis protein [Hyphococcus flavus]WDI32331.1 lipopolysaccharide biosynthesis protein [Hyphococcus flavus]
MSDPANVGGAQSLTTRVAHGAAWIMGAGLFARLIGALNTIIVARLLVPEDIGIVATATIAMQLLQGVSDIGVAQAVVKFRDADRDDLDTLFTFSLIRGVIIAAILFTAAPFAADFYGDPRLFWAFSGIALFPVLLGLVNPKFYEFERDLKFSREFIVVIVNRLVGVAVSLSIAIIFRTYWAIILGLIAGGVVQAVLSYGLRPYAPRFSLKSFRKLIGFSGWLGGVSFMAALNNKLDVPIVSRLVGTSGGGAYFLGFQLSEMVAGQIAMPMTRAIFPGLSEMQGDAARMRGAFLRGVEALGAFAMPAAFGLGFVATDFTYVLLGDKWSAAVPVITFLAPVVGLQSLFFATQAYAVALGLTRLVFLRELVFFVVRTPIFIWAVLAHGLTGGVIAAAGAGLFHVVLNLVLYARASHRGFWEPLLAARRSLSAIAAMAVWFLVLRPNFSSFQEMSALLRLLADVLAGAVIYISAIYGLWRLEGRPEGIEEKISTYLGSIRNRISAN